jgi:Protein of unknown function (DUF1631)
MAPYPLPAALSVPFAGEAAPSFDREAAQALLAESYAQYRSKLVEMARAALDLTSDLFESNSHIPDGEVEMFRARRDEWLELFDKTLAERFVRRLAGERRRGRRPDADASLSSLRVLSAYDHEKQAALKAAAQFLDRFTRRELAALDLRVDVLLPDPSSREIDNPFAIGYVLDALGSSARTIYPSPKVWRPFMERLLADLPPGINKLYISINRLLADRGVLPEIKAALRARSEFRPAEDKDLLPTFSKMLHDANTSVPVNVVVPENLVDAHRAPALVFADRTPPRPSAAPVDMATAKILAGLAALVSAGPPAAAGIPAADPAVHDATEADADFFPSLEPLMALGASTPLFSALARWQRLDLPAALANAANAATPAAASTANVIPLNLIPHLRLAIDDQIANDTDRITMDVIALLFDYVFRDSSIPDDMRRLVGRLQVPIVKAALLDRSFFSDKDHAARRLLDHLAEAAVGATQEGGYRADFTALATEVVDTICNDFEIDVAVFRSADERLRAFIERERSEVAAALSDDVATALRAEADEGDRAWVRAYLRDRLAGLDIPFEVRDFVQTIWADHLSGLRKETGADSEEWRRGVATLDDLLWSIVAQERTAQKARLIKMIPALIAALRRNCTAQRVAPDRAKAFFDALYRLHIAALKPPAAAPGAAAPAPDGALPVAANVAPPAAPGPLPDKAPIDTPTEVPGDAPVSATSASSAGVHAAGTNVHDYVSEMAVGTWLAFTDLGQALNARLTWVSPLRTKYLFTSRSRTRAFVYAPEELAYAIGAGLVTVVVEPVPLFDRAVSAALDTLAARHPPGAAPRPVAA